MVIVVVVVVVVVVVGSGGVNGDGERGLGSLLEARWSVPFHLYVCFLGSFSC